MSATSTGNKAGNNVDKDEFNDDIMRDDDDVSESSAVNDVIAINRQQVEADDLTQVAVDRRPAVRSYENKAAGVFVSGFDPTSPVSLFVSRSVCLSVPVCISLYLSLSI